MLEWCDLHYNSRVSPPCPSVSLRSRRAGSLVALLGLLLPTALYQLNHQGLIFGPDRGGGGGGVCRLSLLAIADLYPAIVAEDGYPPGAQEGPQFSREACPWGIRLAGLIGLYILLCFQ